MTHTTPRRPRGPVLALLVLVAILSVRIRIIAPALLVPTVRQTAQKFASLGRNTVHTTGVNLDATVERATRFLEIDLVSLFQQAHVVEVINERKIPAVVRVDLVVCGHLHPLLEIGENRNTLHRRDSVAPYAESIILRRRLGSLDA